MANPVPPSTNAIRFGREMIDMLDKDGYNNQGNCCGGGNGISCCYIGSCGGGGRSDEKSCGAIAAAVMLVVAFLFIIVGASSLIKRSEYQKKEEDALVGETMAPLNSRERALYANARVCSVEAAKERLGAGITQLIMGIGWLLLATSIILAIKSRPQIMLSNQLAIYGGAAFGGGLLGYCIVQIKYRISGKKAMTEAYEQIKYEIDPPIIPPVAVVVIQPQIPQYSTPSYSSLYDNGDGMGANFKTREGDSDAIARASLEKYRKDRAQQRGLQTGGGMATATAAAAAPAAYLPPPPYAPPAPASSNTTINENDPNFQAKKQIFEDWKQRRAEATKLRQEMRDKAQAAVAATTPNPPPYAPSSATTHAAIDPQAEVTFLDLMRQFPAATIRNVDGIWHVNGVPYTEAAIAPPSGSAPPPAFSGVPSGVPASAHPAANAQQIVDARNVALASVQAKREKAFAEWQEALKKNPYAAPHIADFSEEFAAVAAAQQAAASASASPAPSAPPPQDDA